MRNAYKYAPERFQGVLGLSNELAIFYNLYETYCADPTEENRFALEKHGRDLFFTLKHRRLEGAITDATASEVLSYMEELLR